MNGSQITLKGPRDATVALAWCISISNWCRCSPWRRT